VKILYIVSLFPCWSETFIVREMKSLRDAGADISVLSLKRAKEKLIQSDAKEFVTEVMYSGGLVELNVHAIISFLKRPLLNTGLLLSIIFKLINKPVSLLKSIATWWISLSVIHKVKHLNPDHIHAHWATYPSTSAMIISKNLDIPFSFTSHAHDIFLEDHLLNKKINSSKFSVTISDYNKKRLSKQLQMNLENKMHIVHCGVDLNSNTFIRDGRESSTILAVGRLDNIKGFSVLINACAELAKNNQVFKCNIIGDGPLKELLEQQIKDNKLEEYVELVGVMPQEQVRNYLNTATLFALPSVITKQGDMDGIPVALMEAMASGLPVISTTVSGIPELIHNDINGLIVPPGDAHALSEGITKLLNNQSIRNQYSSAARKTIEKDFSVNIESDKLYQMFLPNKNANNE